jgi:hypothetical protein
MLVLNYFFPITESIQQLELKSTNLLYQRTEFSFQGEGSHKFLVLVI